MLQMDPKEDIRISNNQLCRICGIQLDDAANPSVDIFTSPDLQEKYEFFFHVKVSKRDQFSNRICRKCHDELDTNKSLVMINRKTQKWMKEQTAIEKHNRENEKIQKSNNSRRGNESYITTTTTTSTTATSAASLSLSLLSLSSESQSSVVEAHPIRKPQPALKSLPIRGYDSQSLEDTTSIAAPHPAKTIDMQYVSFLERSNNNNNSLSSSREKKASNILALVLLEREIRIARADWQTICETLKMQKKTRNLVPRIPCSRTFYRSDIPKSVRRT